MAKNLYCANFEKQVHIGGIATGHITLSPCGSLSSQADGTFFTVKAEKDGLLYDAKLLQTKSIDGLNLSCFESSSASSHFPFAEISFTDSKFPAEVKMTSFSPFIPLNDTDSGIPGVVFEFEFTNISEDRVDFSLCCVTKNPNTNSFNRMGCTDTGEAYIFLGGEDEDADCRSIATNGKNVSFCEYIKSHDGFIKNFTENYTLYNKTKSECPVENSCGALCTHFSLDKGETASVTFCYSWYQKSNSLSRNYYAQYFESALECCSYLFRQLDRLKTQSLEFSEYVLGATLPEDVLYRINEDLFSLANNDCLRLDCGTFITNEKENFIDMESFISRSNTISHLFPCLERSNLLHFFKKGLYEKAKSDELCLAILRVYRKYILDGNLDDLIEDWYYVVKCMDILCDEDGKTKAGIDDNLKSAVIESVCIMAQDVKDKKRQELYSSFKKLSSVGQISMDICEGFSKLYEISGFEYSAKDKHIGFYPSSDSCPLDIGETFRSFFCTPFGYGYVEEGIDYIEINLLNGKLDIRSFGVPRTPRLVQYGGRNWRFTNNQLIAVLDSDLEITPHKKLTIFIDIKTKDVKWN